jgi:hypothetical protein
MIYSKSDNQKRYSPLLGYEKIKTEFSKIRSEKWKTDNPNNYRNVKGENNPMYGSKRFGELNPFFGKKHTEETKEKQRRAKLDSGYIFTEEHKQKLKDAQANRPVMICLWCGKETKSASVIKRFHNEKCKLNQSVV